VSEPVITVTELMRNFGAFIGRVAYGGEAFLLKRGKEVVAELRPAAPARPVAELPGTLDGLPPLDPEDARAWAEDVFTGSRLAALEDPWAS
jgi:antitoxin (DNA-binding transcriptional repressor) of toxin-antitoxin stability system